MHVHAAVDDGSDEDHDSHIMVWQLPIVSEEQLLAVREQQQQQQLEVVHSCKNSQSSRASSSLDFGPTPGSGVQTLADSDDDDDDDDKRVRSEAGAEALPETFVESGGADSYSNWNKDVESMLHHISASSSNVQRRNDEDAIKKAPSPKEDFTQHY